MHFFRFILQIIAPLTSQILYSASWSPSTELCLYTINFPEQSTDLVSVSQQRVPQNNTAGGWNTTLSLRILPDGARRPQFGHAATRPELVGRPSGLRRSRRRRPAVTPGHLWDSEMVEVGWSATIPRFGRLVILMYQARCSLRRNAVVSPTPYEVCGATPRYLY